MQDALNPSKVSALSDHVRTALLESAVRAQADQARGHPATNQCPHLWLSILFDMDLIANQNSTSFDLPTLHRHICSLLMTYVRFTHATIADGRYGAASVLRAGVTLADIALSSSVCSSTDRAAFVGKLVASTRASLLSAGLPALTDCQVRFAIFATSNSPDDIAPEDLPPNSGDACKSLHQAYLALHPLESGSSGPYCVHAQRPPDPSRTITKRPATSSSASSRRTRYSSVPRSSPSSALLLFLAVFSALPTQALLSVGDDRCGDHVRHTYAGGTL